MDSYLNGTWEDFEAWIRKAIGSDCRWRICPLDTPGNRHAVAEAIQDAVERAGAFPDGDAFIERADEE